MNRADNAKQFLQEYLMLKDSEKTIFSRIVNKLLGESFLVKEKQEDRDFS